MCGETSARRPTTSVSCRGCRCCPRRCRSPTRPSRLRCARRRRRTAMTRLSTTAFRRRRRPPRSCGCSAPPSRRPPSPRGCRPYRCRPSSGCGRNSFPIPPMTSSAARSSARVPLWPPCGGRASVSATTRTECTRRAEAALTSLGSSVSIRQPRAGTIRRSYPLCRAIDPSPAVTNKVCIDGDDADDAGHGRLESSFFIYATAICYIRMLLFLLNNYHLESTAPACYRLVLFFMLRAA